MKHFTAVSAAALAVIALTATGCASGAATDPSDSGAPEETTSIKIGVLPIFDSAAAQVALDDGYFTEEGLDVEIQVFASSSEVTPALISGDVAFGLTSLVSNFNGLAQNVPLLSVAPGVYSGIDDDDVTAFMVKEDSDIQSLDDLQGATVSIIAFKSQADMVTRAMLDKAGVDLGSVDFVEVKFPDLGAALDADRVDAVTAYEPWQTVLLGTGNRVVARPFTEVFGVETLTQEWVTTEQFAAQSPEVIERFQRAIAKANQALADDPELAREAAGKLIPTLDPAVAAELILPIWRAETDRASYERVLEVMTDYVDYAHQPDFDDYLRLTE